MREHLLEVHRRYPGFTEGCAASCRDDEGRTSYEWLGDVVEPERHRRILDLACGSGVLLEMCADRFPQGEVLVGMDMSESELALAEKRLRGRGAVLHRGLAQDLGFAANGSFDAALCHWALTLMDPVEPVFREVERVLAPGGVFAAIVDGDPSGTPGYTAVDEVIFRYVRAELPGYGDRDLGDPRTRVPETLAELASASLGTAKVSVATSVFHLDGPPEFVAREALGFFYAAFVLPPGARAELLTELEAMFAKDARDGAARFSMPVCRLVARF